MRRSALATAYLIHVINVEGGIPVARAADCPHRLDSTPVPPVSPPPRDFAVTAYHGARNEGPVAKHLRQIEGKACEQSALFSPHPGERAVNMRVDG